MNWPVHHLSGANCQPLLLFISIKFKTFMLISFSEPLRLWFLTLAFHFSHIHFTMYVCVYIYIYIFSCVITTQSHFPYTSYYVYVFHTMCKTQSHNHNHGTHIQTQHETHHACSGLNPSHDLLGTPTPKLRDQAMTLVSISPQ